MIERVTNNAGIKTTSHKAVLPFYMYAAISFLAATVILFFSSSNFLQHYFQPHILAVTHTMALGWGTMIILGASHQLVPVIIEGKLYSHTLAYISFFLAAAGIPMLVYSFYIFNMGEIAKCGGIFIVLSILLYVINLGISISKSKSENVHAIYVLTAAMWLLLTASLGLLLVYNFTQPLLPYDSVHYLSLHAHAGITGWFLLLVIGVASRLAPMFLISKYTNTKLLWQIYILINAALILYTAIFFTGETSLSIAPLLLVFAGIGFFVFYCYRAVQQRIRKKIDEQVKVSLLSVLMMAIPVLLPVLIIAFLSFIAKQNIQLLLAYGFLIFFGWLTAIILGMTFKTLPFIVWNKVYRNLSGRGKTPNPKDLFSEHYFKLMSYCYLAGILVFIIGIFFSLTVLLKAGAALLIITAFLYNLNVIKILLHKP